MVLADIKKKFQNYKMIDKITNEKLDKYFDVTGRAIKKVKISNPDKTHLNKIAQDFMQMATTYYEDAKHFKENNDYINAFAALNYAHGWLDAGARIGIFDVEHDSVLFTVD